MARKVMYLVDTNIWLERLLDQERSAKVDDTYQYVVANQVNAIIVSFDKDFYKTNHARQTPQNV